MPAQQGFGAHQCAADHVDLGLVVELQLAVGQGCLQAADQLRQLRLVAILLGVEPLQSVASVELGQVQGLAGVAQQDVGIACVLGEPRGAHAGRTEQGGAADVQRGAGLLLQALHDEVHLFARLQPFDDHRELVAAQPGQGVALTQRQAKALGQDLQHLVAHGMAVALVERLEVVQVERCHHHRLLIAPAQVQRMFEPVGQQHAVGQTGQGS